MRSVSVGVGRSGLVAVGAVSVVVDGGCGSSGDVGGVVVSMFS